MLLLTFDINFPTVVRSHTPTITIMVKSPNKSESIAVPSEYDENIFILCTKIKLKCFNEAF